MPWNRVWLKIAVVLVETAIVTVFRVCLRRRALTGMSVLGTAALCAGMVVSSGGPATSSMVDSAAALSQVGSNSLDLLSVSATLPAGVSAAPLAGVVSYSIQGAPELGIFSGRDTIFTPSASPDLGSTNPNALQGLTRATGLRVEGLASPLASGQKSGITVTGVSRKDEKLPPRLAGAAVPQVRVWAPATDYLARYQSAAAQYCPTLGWPVLAALGQVESGHGATVGPSSAGALGPAQFMPATWQAMVNSRRAVDADRDGQFNIWDPDDAFATAAVKLCDDGAKSAMGTLQALWQYNHSWSYVALVAQLAHAYNAAYPNLPTAPLPATQNSAGRTLAQAQAKAGVSYSLAAASENSLRAAVLQTARRYLGVQYLWGGTDPNVGLDCSGFTQLVFAQHGVLLPRVSYDQARMGQVVPSLTQALPGDLVTFGNPIDHIGIYLGEGMMIHAPRTGKMVEISPVRFPPTTIRRVLTAGGAAALTLPTVTRLAANQGSSVQVSVLPAAVVGLAAGTPLQNLDQGPNPFAATF